MDEAYCNYYGRLEPVKLMKHQRLGMFTVNDCLRRMLEKHESHLIKAQERLVKNLKLSFADEIRMFQREIKKLSERVKKLEDSKVKKEKPVKE